MLYDVLAMFLSERQKSVPDEGGSKPLLGS